MYYKIYNTISVLNELRVSNSVLKSNEFFGEIIDKLTSFKSGNATDVLEETWRDLQSQVSIERDALVGMLSRFINKRKIGKIVEQLEKLGELRNIREDNGKYLREYEASNQFNERREKLLANYFHKLRVLINGIHNKNVNDEETVKMLIPSHWSKSSNEETLNRLVSNNLKSQATVHKNIEKTNSNPQFNRLVKSLSQL